MSLIEARAAYLASNTESNWNALCAAEDAAFRGDYGSCAAIPMTDEERAKSDAMAAEMCANSACDNKHLLLARRIMDLLKVTK